MIWTILRSELQEHRSNFTLICTLAVLTLLVPLSGYTQGRQYQQMLADYEQRRRLHETEADARSLVLTRPVPRLVAVYNGVYTELPDELMLQPDMALVTPTSSDLRPLSQMFSDVDFGFIVGILLSLVAVLLGHDAITGEREAGTLKLLFSFPIPRRVLLIAKSLAIGFTLLSCLAYTAALYGVCLIVASGGAFQVNGGVLAEVAAVLLISFVALASFAGLGLAVSALARYSSVALVLSVGLWAMAVLVWPIIGADLAAHFYPLTSQQTDLQAMYSREADLIREELAAHESEARRLAEQNASVEQAWQIYLNLRRVWTGRKIEEHERWAAVYWGQQRRHQQASRLFDSLSPFGALRESLGAICQTSLDDHHRFRTRAEAYCMETVLPTTLRALERRGPAPTGEAPRTLAELPPFSLPEPSLPARLLGVMPVLVLLALHLIIPFASAFYLFERYDVY